MQILALQRSSLPVINHFHEGLRPMPTGFAVRGETLHQDVVSPCVHLLRIRLYWPPAC